METTNHTKTEAAQVTGNPASVNTFALKTKTLLQGLNAVKDSASTDPNRYVINGINFKVCLYFENNTPPSYRLSLQSTDGRRASDLILPLDVCNLAEGEVSPSFIVSSETIESLLKLLKKSKDLESVTFAWTPQKSAGESVKVELQGVTSFKSVYGNYPSFHQLFNDIRRQANRECKPLEVTEILKSLRDIEGLTEGLIKDTLEKVKKSDEYKSYIESKGQLEGEAVCKAVRKSILSDLTKDDEKKGVRFDLHGGKYHSTIATAWTERMPAILSDRPKHLDFGARINWEVTNEQALAFNQSYLKTFLDQLEVLSKLGLKTSPHGYTGKKETSNLALYYKAEAESGLSFECAIMPQMIR